ncbi:hypothetical protein I5M27_18470 [Adhaeribacter sp. BT258]|uniref:Immunity protein 63 domain-containing protein n=1 Tax=Adhaeribacter terrigena TaxID=2793070 RepID=A0ABS1C6X2_9BACT|nr:Imm63 family immunity protein [Adhaeribacter terrigena]MBK0404976.1 hypothetical protein [Adhaeribacter terrigena]
MRKFSLEDIKSKVDELANKINAPKDLLPDYGSSRDFAYPHIELDNLGLLSYVIIERGQELERKVTDKLEELLYWIFDDVTFSMAINYELENRIENEDVRRISFKKQEELLEALDESWGLKCKEEHTHILKNHPFDDLAGLRATYCRELREKGIAETEIKKLAYTKYPEK